MSHVSLSRLLFVFILSLTATASFAESLELNRYFSDEMVLQRDQPITITGQAKPAAKVTASFKGQTKTATAAADGTWAVTLDAMKADAKGQPLTVKSDGETVTLKDVVVGDVILYARQTYIDVALDKTEQGKQAAHAFKPSDNFRAISIKTIPAKKPQADLAEGSTAGWSKVDAASAAKMSAAAFYLGRDLAADLDGVVVGMIDLNMGPYFAIGWMSDAALEGVITRYDDKEVRWIKENFPKRADARDDGSAQRELDEYYEQEKARGRAGAKPSLGIHPIKIPMYPSAGYNAVLNPLRDVAFKAVVLQLGSDYPYIPYSRLDKEGLAQTIPELDAAWSQNYWVMKNGYRTSPRTTPHLIEDWRKTFGDEQLPIAWVQPPSSDLNALGEHNREMRELQRRIAEDSDNVGLILPGMENVDRSGQPADEKLLADRAKRWVLADVYGETDVVATGPQFDKIDAYLTNATVYFKPGTADGLKATGDALARFEVASPGGEFLPATAKIDGSTIKLHNPDVGQIAYVRYDWDTKPGGGLVNAVGLPALPFNSDDRWEFMWYYPDKDTELPEEYFTHADEWGDGNVAIINGAVEFIVTGDSERTPRRPGPLGIFSSEFGPNLYVISIDPGTPAVGKVMPGDYIYGVNGKKFEGPDDLLYHQLADAITYSESDAGEGKIDLMIRRGSKLMTVTLDLGVQGTYSPTSPFYCEKTNNIIERAKQWSYKRYRPNAGPASNPGGMLGTDVWFLLATGDPQVQGLVRRFVYEKLANDRLPEPDPTKPAHNWGIGYDAILIGEYYHATGDPNVLPLLKKLAGWAAVTQITEAGPEEVTWEVAQRDEHVGGYRQRYNPLGKDRWMSGYGLMPPAGTACVSGIVFAKEAGLPVDEQALKDGLRHFRYQRAEHGYVEYLYSNLRTDSPPAIRPEAEANGKLSSLNGKLGQAAALFRIVDDHQPVEICSRYCVYAYNNTRYGHGGMFFNNMWTPIGAHAAGDAGFKHFMQGNRWWRELFRRHDGSFNQVGRGGIGVGYALPYVAPRERLRILGAPKSVFGPACPEYLKPAVEAHQNRQYKKAEQLAQKAIAETDIPPQEQAMIDHYLESLRILQASIDYDLTYVEEQIKAGNYDYALMELPQLQGVVAADNARLQAVAKALGDPKVKDELKKLRGWRTAEKENREKALKAALPKKPKEKWVDLTPWRKGDQKAGDATVWKMKVIEDIVQAPKNWTQPDYDDKSWNETTLPISWAMYHTALFRTNVNIKDVSKYDALRFRGAFFQQGNVEIYINGKLVAKVDNIGRGVGMSNSELTDYAYELLKNGENTIAVKTRHKRRWGALRGKYTTAAGFGILFDARLRE